MVVDGCPTGDRCGAAIEGHPWSPDGHQIAFIRAIWSGAEEVPSNVGLWLLNADGTGAHQLTLKNISCLNDCVGDAQDDYAGWSPDGTRLIFQRETYTTPKQFAVFTIAVDGSDLRRVTPEDLESADPPWSPDGSLIVFSHEPSGTFGSDLFVMNRDGSNPHVLAVTDLNESAPFWVPPPSLHHSTHVGPTSAECPYVLASSKCA